MTSPITYLIFKRLFCSCSIEFRRLLKLILYCFFFFLCLIGGICSIALPSSCKNTTHHKTNHNCNNCFFLHLLLFPTITCYYLIISSTFAVGFTVISIHAGKNPLFMAFLIDLILDQAEQ